MPGQQIDAEKVPNFNLGAVKRHHRRDDWNPATDAGFSLAKSTEKLPQPALPPPDQSTLRVENIVAAMVTKEMSAPASSAYSSSRRIRYMIA